MPHATEDTTMDEAGEADAIQSFLQNQDGFYGGGDSPIDQRDKAQDAVDYEDISDEDDLPEEEEASRPLQEDEDEDANGLVKRLADGLNGLPNQSQPSPPVNQYQFDFDEDDGKEAAEGDLFGESDDALFGENSLSPEQHRVQPVGNGSTPSRPGGLALPSQQSSLALPGFGGSGAKQRGQLNRVGDSPTPMSPYESDGYSPAQSVHEEDSDADLDPEVRMQRDLIGMSQRRVAGENVESGWGAFDADVFYNIYPRYEPNQNPDFIDLFPQRAVTYRGKVPFKAPKALQPTKLSLDILQDHEKSFKAPAGSNKQDAEVAKPGLVVFGRGSSSQDDSDDDLMLSMVDENERIGGVTLNDLAMLCDDWDIPEADSQSDFDLHEDVMEQDWEQQERVRPTKRARIDILDTDFSLSLQDAHLPFEEPEKAAAKISKYVALDMNDPNLLIDEVEPQAVRRPTHSEQRRDVATTKDLARRYNISNDEAYDLLKENHQHKIRSTLGSMAVEHSLPAIKLQYPFYKVNLDPMAKRAFHRPHLHVRDSKNRQFRIQKLKHIKRKAVRGRDPKDLFHKAEDLSLGDNSSVLLLEYSEEAPMVLSNFGMGSRLINYYRKRNADDQERPKRDVGETQVLLTQDKSPFANFGHVDQGEMVPTVQNGLYRAPIFEHKPKSADFLVGLSTTYNSGNRFYIRNVENLHVVGQQFPLAEVPTEHSRKVTDASKKRLRAISYRIYTKSVDPLRPGKTKPLNNENIMRHLPGHDMPQTRSKMREFMKYDKAPGKDSGGVWVPPIGAIVPDAETLRSWIKPEDVCLLESMQVGVQHLTDLGLYSNSKDADEDKDVDDGANIEIKLAPWQATKNFLNACQGKAMLKLHGEGDPTSRGEGFDFVKTSMKGGFQALGESAQDKVDAKKRKETGGHSYNVAKQQKAYDKSIRWIWDKQKQSLSSNVEFSDTEIDEEPEAEAVDQYARAATPRSAFGTPSVFGRTDDESASQYSRGSADRGDKVMVITRTRRNELGEMETTYERVTDVRIMKAYRKKAMEKKLQELSALDLNPTGDPEEDEFRRQKIQAELNRVNRNVERRQAREKAKGKSGGASAHALNGTANGVNSPATGVPEDGDAAAEAGASGAPAVTTPQKTGRGRNKDGTARKCANCGQVGHIKTNRKSVIPSFNCIFCGQSNFVPITPNEKNALQSIGDGKTRADPASASAKAYLRDDFSAFQL